MGWFTFVRMYWKEILAVLGFIFSAWDVIMDFFNWVWSLLGDAIFTAREAIAQVKAALAELAGAARDCAAQRGWLEVNDNIYTCYSNDPPGTVVFTGDLSDNFN